MSIQLPNSHEEFKVYWKTILNEEYGYRLITRGELNAIREEANNDSIIMEDLVCKKCTRYVPDDFPGWDDCLAGIPFELSKEILDKSGYLSEKSVRALEQEAADWAKTQDARFDSLICFCFPGTTVDMLDELSPQDWHRRAAMAQLIVAGIYGIDPSGFLDPSKDLTENTTQPKQAQQRYSRQEQPITPHDTTKVHGVNNRPTEIQTEGVFSFTN